MPVRFEQGPNLWPSVCKSCALPTVLPVPIWSLLRKENCLDKYFSKLLKTGKDNTALFICPYTNTNCSKLEKIRQWYQFKTLSIYTFNEKDHTKWQSNLTKWMCTVRGTHDLYWDWHHGRKENCPCIYFSTYISNAQNWRTWDNDINLSIILGPFDDIKRIQQNDTLIWWNEKHCQENTSA